MDSFFTGLYIEDEKLEAYAANCARLLRPEGGGGAAPEAAALRRQIAAVRRCTEAVGRR